jgi:pyridoxine 4-dehydrogenase
MALRAEGLIRHLGVSNVTQAQFTRARTIADVVCVPNRYNIAERDDDPLVDACAEARIAYVPFFPVGGVPAKGRARHRARARNYAAGIMSALLTLSRPKPGCP